MKNNKEVVVEAKETNAVSFSAPQLMSYNRDVNVYNPANVMDLYAEDTINYIDNMIDLLVDEVSNGDASPDERVLLKHHFERTVKRFNDVSIYNVISRYRYLKEQLIRSIWYSVMEYGKYISNGIICIQEIEYRIGCTEINDIIDIIEECGDLSQCNRLYINELIMRNMNGYVLQEMYREIFDTITRHIQISVYSQATSERSNLVYSPSEINALYDSIIMHLNSQMDASLPMAYDGMRMLMAYIDQYVLEVREGVKLINNFLV